MLNVNTNSTVNGIDNIKVGAIDTRAKNQHCWINSRQAKGRLGIATIVSTAKATKSPTEPSGLATVLRNVTL
jgi:hypothetical protein